VAVDPGGIVEASSAAIMAAVAGGSVVRGFFLRRRARQVYERAVERLISEHRADFRRFLREEKEEGGP
jgi:hypothetical protein